MEQGLLGAVSGVRSIQGHPTVGLSLGPYDGPRGGAVSYERGTPAPLAGSARVLSLFGGEGSWGSVKCSEVASKWKDGMDRTTIQGHLAHKKTPTPL